MPFLCHAIRDWFVNISSILKRHSKIHINVSSIQTVNKKKKTLYLNWIGYNLIIILIEKVFLSKLRYLCCSTTMLSNTTTCKLDIVQRIDRNFYSGCSFDWWSASVCCVRPKAFLWELRYCLRHRIICADSMEILLFNCSKQLLINKIKASILCYVAGKHVHLEGDYRRQIILYFSFQHFVAHFCCFLEQIFDSNEIEVSSKSKLIRNSRPNNRGYFILLRIVSHVAFSLDVQIPK